MPRPIESLLKVQQRRVATTMAELRARNQQVLQAQLAREAAQSRWSAADAERQRQLRTMADMSAGAITTVRVGDLARTASSLDWWRARLEEEKKLLQEAEVALTHARSALEHARIAYRQAHARQEGLLQLAEQQRRALDQKRLRAQELSVEDVLQGRHGVSSKGVLQ